MPYVRRLLFIILSLLAFAPAFSFSVSAQSVTVNAQVGDTVLTLRGYTSPNSLVIFTENSAVKGTTYSNPDGSFEKTFTAQDPGLHIITITSTDPEGVVNIGIVEEIFLIGYIHTEVNNLYLPPTITVETISYTSDNDLLVHGYSKPNSTVEVNIEGPSGFIVLVPTDANGLYEYRIETSLLEPGDYTVSTRLIDVMYQSLPSHIINFSIIAPEPEGPPQVIIPPTTPPEEGSCPVLYIYPRICFFDRDQNGFIDLSSELQRYILGFSKYFGQKVDNAFDINEDGIVTSEDLSIILYYSHSFSGANDPGGLSRSTIVETNRSQDSIPDIIYRSEIDSPQTRFLAFLRWQLIIFLIISAATLSIYFVKRKLNNESGV